MENKYLHNPHLDGEPFFWEAGPIGVLLLHGYTATPAEVRPLARNLEGRGVTVAGPLLAGHGTIPSALNHVHWQDWVSSTQQSYQQLCARCERVFVGGESMGGVLALYLATLHPQLAGVLCYAPAIKLTLKFTDVIKLRLASLFISQIPRNSLDCADKWQGYPNLPLKGALQLLQLQRAVLKRLPMVNQPILVVQGRKDTTVHPAAGKIILESVCSTIKEHHWMEHSSHPILLDRELDSVTHITVDFMEKALASIRREESRSQEKESS